MYIFLGVWFGVGVVLMLIFHFTTRKDPAAPVPPTKEERLPAKLIPKKDAWADQPSYDYERTSMMAEPVTPIEPGDSDPPEPYE